MASQTLPLSSNRHPLYLFAHRIAGIAYNPRRFKIRIFREGFRKLLQKHLNYNPI